MKQPELTRLTPAPKYLWVALLLAGAFALGAVYTLSDGIPSTPVGWVNLTIQLAVAVLMTFTYFRVRKDDREMEGFLHWLVDHRESIKRGDAYYEGTPIRLHTETRCYSYCISAILLSIRGRSKTLIEGRDSFNGTNAFYTLITLLAGWWSIPLGPFFTVMSLATNLRGGIRQTIADIITDDADFARGSFAQPSAPSRLSILLRALMIVISVPASIFAVVFVVLWLGRDHVIVLDNTTKQPLKVSFDRHLIGTLQPVTHLKIEPESGEHEVTVTDPAGNLTKHRLVVPERSDPFIGFRGVFDLGGAGRYALVTVCYGECDDDVVEVRPYRQKERFFLFPDAISTGTDIDEAFPDSMPISTGRRQELQTHLCHLSAGGSVACKVPGD